MPASYKADNCYNNFMKTQRGGGDTITSAVVDACRDKEVACLSYLFVLNGGVCSA